MTWKTILSEQSWVHAQSLADKAEQERKAEKNIYPPREDVFRALTLTLPEEVRVVIVGQDPYHGAGQANGLAFSVNRGLAIPPSLRNILSELQSDLGHPAPEHGDLALWAHGGILLLNTVLTVEEGKPNSHAKWGWQDFVRDVFRACLLLPQPIVFLLWGGQARAFTASLQLSVHPNKAVIHSSHPSPLGAFAGNESVPAFIGSKPFSRANELLQKMGSEPVDWQLQKKKVFYAPPEGNAKPSK